MTHAFPVILGGIFGLQGPELIALIFLVVLLFGAKKLPDLARGVGQSLKEFKKASSTDEQPADNERPAPSKNGAAKPEAKVTSGDSK